MPGNNARMSFMNLFKKTLLAAVVCTSLVCSAKTNTEPQITAKAWLVADESGHILGGTNTTDVRSIASITKLMTVMIVLDAGQALNEIIPTKLYNKEQTRQTLIDLAMVKSDNQAAKLLCDYYPGGFSACVTAMNNKASELEMPNTKFADPTGLTVMNVSTAEDLIKLVQAASHYDSIVTASNKPSIIVPAKKNKLTFHNTNPLTSQLPFLVSKTGFINRSGGCIVMMLPTINGIRTVVLLGSKNTHTRIPEARMISLRY
jgi:D-alanyl-D-alanine endopeptidase (penicillin-binding protein 7)